MLRASTGDNSCSFSIGRRTSLFNSLWIIWFFTGAGEALSIPLNYSNLYPPPPSASPSGRLELRISLRFINILGINEIKGEMQISCFHRVYWNDTRLPVLEKSLDNAILSDYEKKIVWRPDIITQNVRNMEPNGIIKPTTYYARHLNTAYQDFVHSSYIAISIGCTFQYSAYPMDVQACTVNVGTMGFTTLHANLAWHPYYKYSLRSKAFLQFQDLFKIRICENVQTNLRKSTFGNHPQKTLIIILQRNYRSLFLQLYLPSVVFVMIAWLSVLVPPTMLRTRLLLNSTNLLTIISMFLFISKTESSRLPKVSYLTALNLWMFACVGFCFSSVILVILDIRLVVILSMPGRQQLQIMRNMFRFWDDHETPADVQPKSSDKQLRPPPSITIQNQDPQEDDAFQDAEDNGNDVNIDEAELRSRVAEKRLEWLSKTAGFEQLYLYLYPILFALFTLIYFSYYLWLRGSHLHHMIHQTGGAGALYPGCWCFSGDTHPKCMKPTD